MTQTTAEQIAEAAAEFAPVAQMIADALLPGAGKAASIGIKLAIGALTKAPKAVALVEQFQNGNIPTQAELDDYAATEDETYKRLLAHIAAARH